MKEMVLVILGIATVLLGAVAYQRHNVAASSEALAHVHNEFEFTVKAPYALTAPLFGPEGERAWGGEHWDPHFLYPQPAQDVRGAVFMVEHGHHRSYWINTAFDLEGRHIQYAYVIPDLMATLIDLKFSEVDAANTKVAVTYERTALTSEANDHVREAGIADSKNGPEWGKLVNDYLMKQHAGNTEPASASPIHAVR